MAREKENPNWIGKEIGKEEEVPDLWQMNLKKGTWTEWTSREMQMRRENWRGFIISMLAKHTFNHKFTTITAKKVNKIFTKSLHNIDNDCAIYSYLTYTGTNNT